MTLKGQPLAPGDYTTLEARWIDEATAKAANLRRVDSAEGGAIVGRNGSGDYSGVIIPYIQPGSDRVQEYRLRLDHPPMERDHDGTLKAQQRYLSPPGRANMLYFPPCVAPDLLADVSAPMVITEGEFKCLSLYRLSIESGVKFVAVGLSGVWNWRSVLGKATDETGTRVDIKGVIGDFDLITWTGRRVVIAFDADVTSKPSVRAAQIALSRELARRGASVFTLAWPDDVRPEQKGIDDYLATYGPEVVLEMMQAATPVSDVNGLKFSRSIAQVPLVRSVAAEPIAFAVEGVCAVGTVTLITSESGDGKSTLVTALAAKVNHGEPFAGRQTRQMPVLILDRENPISVVVERFNRLGVTDSDTFKYWGGWLEEEAPEPTSPVVIDWVKSCTPRPLVIIDSVIAFHRGAENDAAEIRKTFDQFRLLANLGCTVIALHHSGKADSAKDFRGSSDVKAAVDVAYHLSRSGDPARLDLLKLRAFKQRFSVDAEILLRYVDGEFLAGQGGHVVTIADRLAHLLRTNPGIQTATFESLAVREGVSRARSRDYLNEGVMAGRIRRESEAGKNSKRHYLNQEENGFDYGEV